jgi:hypothetical protein
MARVSSSLGSSTYTGWKRLRTTKRAADSNIHKNAAAKLASLANSTHCCWLLHCIVAGSKQVCESAVALSQALQDG